ncbi:protein TAB2 homolog, chloroplastic-like isoform X2 [Hibiscus syriacus]|uniref:protein TAB2 homolog, chloroplastic-like isoform X2 n=1 Tax=Hibiscus syriacus TaxID=106335 RepID=UPI001923004B|nr:protein TAB2 homolog, chloroplastic-like isoform X2 [Hibiscus syriacus]
MATLTFNSSRIKSPSIQSLKAISKSHFLTQPNNLAFLFSSKNHHQLHHFKPNSVSESSVSVPKEAFDDSEEEDPTSELSYLDPEADPASVTEWELDFCSRPILDIRGKKIWELVVCDSSLSLQYTKYFPNNVINSVTLKEAVVTISEDLGVPLPEKVRFFRSQMQTIITKACKELGIKPVPSKRCLSLLLWLEERYESVYMRHPGFQKGSKPLLALDNPFPMELSENLFGEKWAFVQLPFSAVREDISSLDKRFVFGAGLDLDLLGIEVDDNTLIPGLAVATSRAKPLAGSLDEWFGSVFHRSRHQSRLLDPICRNIDSLRLCNI